jgi:ESS family glutamate:Na+ symporter
MTLTLSAWWLPLLAIPVLLLGERIQRHVRLFDRYSIPVSVVGGMAICLLILSLDLSGLLALKFDTKVNAGWWTWLVTPGPEWVGRPLKGINLPLLIGFFTCIGLNATWSVVRKGSWQMPLFLALATLLAILQNVVGVGLAKLLNVHPLLGIICGSLSQTGGIGTSLGFADVIVHAGYAPAATMGVAASTFGMICGSLVGGPIATRLIRRNQLVPEKTENWKEVRASENEALLIENAHHAPGILADIRAFAGQGKKAVGHLLLLAVLIKVGAWVSWFFQSEGLIFPPYMGSLLAGLVLRNVLDRAGKSWIDSHTVDLMGAVLLALFLSMAMMSLNLKELAGSAIPMLVILAAQVVLVIGFTTWITFRWMGRDYDAAVMASGHCGFGHGATPNAIANMESITRKMGPAHRAFIIIPIVGGMFIDITNSFVITWFINLVKDW